jgi:hypothetical protein
VQKCAKNSPLTFIDINRLKDCRTALVQGRRSVACQRLPAYFPWMPFKHNASRRRIPRETFVERLDGLLGIKWVVYAKRPFAGPSKCLPISVAGATAHDRDRERQPLL